MSNMYWNKVNKTTVDSFFSPVIVITAFHIFNPVLHISSAWIRKLVTLLKVSTCSIIQLVKLQQRSHAGCFCSYMISFCLVSPCKLVISLTALQDAFRALTCCFDLTSNASQIQQDWLRFTVALYKLFLFGYLYTPYKRLSNYNGCSQRGE